MNIESKIIDIKGIGDKKAQDFSRLGIETVYDLITYYPRAYKRYTDPVKIRDTSEGDRVSLFCKVVSYVETVKGRRYTITSLTASDDSGSIRMVWYNMPFIRNIFRKGDSYVFFGTVKYKGAMRILEMPEYYTQFNYQKMLSTLQPIYPLKSGITNNLITKTIQTVSNVMDSFPEYLLMRLLPKMISWKGRRL
jgi:ATP-dependent DNA helicase RecG